MLIVSWVSEKLYEVVRLKVALTFKQVELRAFNAESPSIISQVEGPRKLLWLDSL